MTHKPCTENTPTVSSVSSAHREHRGTRNSDPHTTCRLVSSTYACLVPAKDNFFSQRLEIHSNCMSADIATKRACRQPATVGVKACETIGWVVFFFRRCLQTTLIPLTFHAADRSVTLSSWLRLERSTFPSLTFVLCAGWAMTILDLHAIMFCSTLLR